MKRILIITSVLLAFLPASALASNYPSQALANSTLKSFINNGVCGKGTFKVCDGVNWVDCSGTVGNNALYCNASYSEHTFGNPFATTFCYVNLPTRVGKISEGVARVVYYTDSCHYPGGFYP